MSIKTEIIGKINSVADDTGNSNIRAALGAPGHTVKLSTGQLVKTGLAFDESDAPKTLATLIAGIADYIGESSVISVKKISGSYSASNTDRIIQVQGPLSALVTVTLPNATEFGSGNSILVKMDGAVGLEHVNIAARSGQSIDGNPGELITTDYGWREMYCDGQKWLISSSN